MKTLRNLLVAAAALAFAAPALADRGHGHGRGYDKHRHHKVVQRHVHYHPPVRVYHAPVRVYQPRVYVPRVYHPAPPVVVHPLAPLLSIRFDFPL